MFVVPWLVFLVDDLVELFMQEDGEALFPVLWCWDIIGMVVGDLADVVWSVEHCFYNL